MDELFHAYDIRGKITNLNSTFAKKLALGMAHYFKSGKIILGFDARKNSKDLSMILGKELLNYGFNIECIGLSSTPYFYHSVISSGADGGVMITASHLPKDMNGFKICGKNAIPVAMGSGLEKIQKFIKTKKSYKNKKGTKIDSEYLDSYKELFAKQKIKQKIQIDCSNGTGTIEANILAEIFSEVKILNSETNVENAKHSLNPLDSDALSEVKQNAKFFDFSVVFDADADRGIFIDDKGRDLPADVLGAILSKNYHNVVRDVSCTNFLDIKKKNVFISKVGRSNIGPLMTKYNADFGYEKSGHVFFKKFHDLDNPGLAVVELAKLLKKEKKKLSQILDSLPKYHSTYFSIDGAVNLQEILIKLKKFRKGEESWLDGLSYDMGDAFINIRHSNTEPITRIAIESKSKRVLNNIKRLIS